MPTGIRNTLPGPSARCAILTGVARPNVQSICVRIGMQRLHTGDNAKPPEARDVRGGNSLDVLDARAAIARVVCAFSVLIGVQCSANSIITNSVSEKLKAALIEFRNGVGVFRWIPK